MKKLAKKYEYQCPEDHKNPCIFCTSVCPVCKSNNIRLVTPNYIINNVKRNLITLTAAFNDDVITTFTCDDCQQTFEYRSTTPEIRHKLNRLIKVAQIYFANMHPAYNDDYVNIRMKKDGQVKDQYKIAKYIPL